MTEAGTLIVTSIALMISLSARGVAAQAVDAEHRLASVPGTSLAAVAFDQEALLDGRPSTEAVSEQSTSSPPDGQLDQEPHRILGIIPNYRTSPTLKDYQPLTPREKLKMATEDSFDRGTFVLAGLFAADAQLTTSTPSFGHGIAAYPRYYAAAMTDFVVGDFMTEAVLPALLRQDPRYFRRGTGSGWSRLGYAVGQIFWTHTDSGGAQFNVSEIAGNATAVAIGNAYYPDNRTVSANVFKVGVQIGVDMAANILKEFAPDLDHVFSRAHDPAALRP
jgi:hypothetical protein